MQTAIDGNEADYGLILGDTIGFTANIDSYETTVDTLDTKRAEEAAAKGGRDNGRGVTVENASLLIKKIRLHVGNDPEKLGAAGLYVYDTTSSASPAPESVPFALIDYGILQHTIKFRDARQTRQARRYARRRNLVKGRRPGTCLRQRLLDGNPRHRQPARHFLSNGRRRKISLVPPPLGIKIPRKRRLERNCRRHR